MFIFSELRFEFRTLEYNLTIIRIAHLFNINCFLNYRVCFDWRETNASILVIQDTRMSIYLNILDIQNPNILKVFLDDRRIFFNIFEDTVIFYY